VVTVENSRNQTKSNRNQQIAGGNHMVTDDNNSFKHLLRCYTVEYMQPLNRQETEDLILDLYYNKKKTFREIQKIVRKSPRDISNVLNKVEPQRSSLCPSSQAYRMFIENKTPTQVAIALNLREKEVSEYFREYWQLEGLYNLDRIYEEIKTNLWSVVELYKQVKAENMNIIHVIRLLKVANNDIPSVENSLQELEREEDDLKFRNERAARTAQEIGNRISSERQILDQFRIFVKQQQQEVERLYSEKKGLADIVKQFRNNDETYIIIKEMVKEQIESVLAAPRQLLRLALASMVESSRKNPSIFQALYYNMPSTRAVIVQRSFLQSVDDREEQQPNQYVNNGDDACEKLLLDQAELIYNQMLENIANTCINKITNDTYPLQLSSLQSPKELSDLQYDQSDDEGKPTGHFAFENDLITTNVASDMPESQIHGEENGDITTYSE
jgi:hypothetical protein